MKLFFKNIWLFSKTNEWCKNSLKRQGELAEFKSLREKMKIENLHKEFCVERLVVVAVVNVKREADRCSGRHW
jgi:hypothetical protein